MPLRDNPWLDLPVSPPYVLPSDARRIDAFNSKAKDEHKIHLDLMPEPFLGRPDAPVVLLNLNPGFCEQDRVHHQNAEFLALSRANLLHELEQAPFYLLHPTVDAPGRKWWERKLGPVIRECGVEAVSQAVLCVELAPYHSLHFAGPMGLPSQTYSFELVRNAIERRAIIIGMRSKRLWEKAVPELASYDQLCFLANPQNPTISLGNCDRYSDVVDAIGRAD